MCDVVEASMKRSPNARRTPRPRAARCRTWPRGDSNYVGQRDDAHMHALFARLAERDREILERLGR